MRPSESSAAIGAVKMLLGADHAQLEIFYVALKDAYGSGDWREVGAAWERFETALRHHMRREEELVFPTFMTIDPEEATALVAEHNELRHLLSELGVSIEIHFVSLPAILMLLERLRSHAEREDRILYPCAVGIIANGTTDAPPARDGDEWFDRRTHGRQSSPRR